MIASTRRLARRRSWPEDCPRREHLSAERGAPTSIRTTNHAELGMRPSGPDGRAAPSSGAGHPAIQGSPGRPQSWDATPLLGFTQTFPRTSGGVIRQRSDPASRARGRCSCSAGDERGSWTPKRACEPESPEHLHGPSLEDETLSAAASGRGDSRAPRSDRACSGGKRVVAPGWSAALGNLGRAMLYAALLYGTLLTPILAWPALLLMDRLEQWVTRADPRSAGAACVGARTRPTRAPAGGHPASPGLGRSLSPSYRPPLAQPGRPGSQPAVTS
jgi:hypothetical protein